MAITGESMKAEDAADNLFPEALRRLAVGESGTSSPGMTLLRQQLICSGPDADLPGCAARLLHGSEIAQAATYRLLKRRTEFLAGRVSAKLALAEFWAAKGCRRDLSSVKIVNDPTGRPRLRMEPVSGEDRHPPEISISHGGDYGAALAADAPCGIDLQEQKDTLLRVLDKYCAAEEARILAGSLPDMPPPGRLSILWAAKEAAKKACSFRWMPGFLDLKLDGPVRQEAGCRVLTLRLTRMPENCGLPGIVTVLATTFDNYGLAICILTRLSHEH